jgi:hypothetical protein
MLPNLRPSRSTINYQDILTSTVRYVDILPSLLYSYRPLYVSLYADSGTRLQVGKPGSNPTASIAFTLLMGLFAVAKSPFGS